MTINEQFFDLIRVALGRKVCLSHSPSASEWGELYAMAKKQSLVGVCFAGVQKLYNDNANDDDNLSNHSNTSNLSELQYLTWMGMAAKIQQRNEVVNRQCVDLQKRLSADGLRSAILKGQGIATLYKSVVSEVSGVSKVSDLSALRQSGDIDVWVPGGAETALTYARKYDRDVSFDYINAHLPVYDDTEVELHWRVQAMTNLCANRKMQRWVAENEAELLGGSVSLAGHEVTVPSLAFNRVYVLLHIYHHVIEGGVGLRQLMDYFFVLQASEGMDLDDCMRVLRSLVIERFARGIMWALAYIFEGKDCSEPLPWMICKPLRSEGRFLLNEVMAGGNFGHHDERIKNTGLKGVWGEKATQMQHLLLVAKHYPSEIFWTPVWIVFHKLWKLFGKH